MHSIARCFKDIKYLGEAANNRQNDLSETNVFKTSELLQ